MRRPEQKQDVLLMSPAVAAATEKRDAVLFRALSVAIIYPLRLMLPSACLCALILLLELGDPLAFARYKATRVAVHALVAVEIGFHLWYLRAKQRLQRRHTPPALVHETRMELLLKMKEESGVPYKFLDRWFPGASSLSEVGRDDLVTWLAWAFFGKHVHEVQAEGPDAAQELEDLAREIETAVATRGVNVPPGSTGVTIRRLNLDPVTSKHRPFVYYAATALMGAAASCAIRLAGFKRYTLGSLWYYVLEPTQDELNAGHNGTEDAPLVFVHGVGMGLAMYVFFILKLTRSVMESTSSGSAGRRIMLIELPHLSLKLGQENVPSVSEFVTSVELAIRRHQFGPSRWIGHSLGSCLAGAFTKAKPELVHSLVLIDPVCFLLWEVDVLENFSRQPASAMQDIIHYHMSQELFISHFFHRHFWWYESVLFPSDIPLDTGTVVFVSERDEISHPRNVLKYLSHVASSKRRHGTFTVHELKGEGHGAWLLRPATQTRLVAAIVN